MIYDRSEFGTHITKLECQCKNADCTAYVVLEKYKQPVDAGTRWAVSNTEWDYMLELEKIFIDSDAVSVIYFDKWYSILWEKIKWRVKNAFSIIFKGSIKLNSVIILTEEGIKNLESYANIIRQDQEYSKYEQRALITDDSKDWIESQIMKDIPEENMVVLDD